MESAQGDSPSIGPSNEDELLKKILGSSSPESEKCVLYVKPLLNIINVIFSGAFELSGFIKGSPTHNIAAIQVLEDKYKEHLTMVIKISDACRDNVEDERDVDRITMEILKITNKYNWDAKVVLALACFAVAFGECRLVSQLYVTNPLARSIAKLKYGRQVLEDAAEALKPVVDGFFTLIEGILHLTNKIVDFYDCPLHNYFSTESPEIVAANSYIPLVVYWVISSIVVSLTQTLALSSTGIGSLLETEQSELAKKLKDLRDQLVKRIEYRNRCIENKKKDGFQDMARILGSSNVDNSESLKIFLEKPGLYDCDDEKKISYEDLKNKVVALFITDLDSDLINGAEYVALKQSYDEKGSHDDHYEVVWVPIWDDNNNNWTDEEFKLFKSLRNEMEWHSVDNPSNLDMMVIRYIKEEWNFIKKPLFVVMDAQGKVVHKNGIYMMFIWRSLAYPFTTTKEKLLWNEMRWSIDLLIGNFKGMNTDTWNQEKTHICLYGGEDENWIKSFTTIGKDIASAFDIHYELLYVGRSKVTSKVKNIMDIIEIEDLSSTLDLIDIRYFWVRLESMLFSKQLAEWSENDPIIQGIRALLRYDSEQKNWAIISNRERDHMIMVNGEDVIIRLRLLSQRWQRDISFVLDDLDEYLPDTFAWFSPSNEDELIKKLHGRNSLNSENCVLYVKPFFDTIQSILIGAVGHTRGLSPTHDDIAAIQVLASMYDEIPIRVIQAICREIYEKCRDGVDVHTITMEILEIAKHYNWDAKVMLALVPFAINFFEFLLVVQLSVTNPIAKAIYLLKQFPELEMESELVDSLFALIWEIFDVTKKIVDIYDFPLHNYFTAESPEIIAVSSYIPIAVYWIIRSIVVSLTQVLALTSTGIVFLITEQSESAQKLNDIKGHLVELIGSCDRSIENQSKDGYQDMARILGSSNADNSKSLKIFLDRPGLYDCYNKRKISYERLKNKVVALFITDLDSELTCGAECAILQQLYLEKWHNPMRTESKYEVIWIPIVINNNWTAEEFELFENLRNRMEWHSVDNPSNVDLKFIRFIKEEWNFVEKPLVVVMDAQGKIVNKNGIYMMCIWGSLAYPFTTVREEVLWKEMKWSIDLLVDNIELNMDIWIQDGKHICLYGGEDLNWIKRFTKFAKGIASEAAISLKLLYVGRSKLKNKMVKITDFIEKENISRTLDWSLIWYFWVRLESMLYSKLLMKSNENDPIMQGIHALLRYDSEQENWAIISSKSGEMVLANGEDMLKGLRQISKRNPSENKRGFVDALDEYIRRSRIAPAASNDYTSHMLIATVSKKDYEAFNVIERLLESTDIHYLKSRGVLFHNKYRNRAFYDFHNKKRISSNNLRRKIVVLFITDLDPEILYGQEYATLEKMYIEKQHNPTRTESQYDVVWVPISPEFRVRETCKAFESIREKMEWQSMNPFMVPPADIEYIQQNWYFSKEPKLVVMDRQCKIVHNDPIHMMCIWRNQAYPFSTEREKFLWDDVTWWIDLLLENIEPNMGSSGYKWRYICLYGGEDIDWIKEFTHTAKYITNEKAGISLEMLYVGKINSKMSVLKNIEKIIQDENKLTRTLEWNLISEFWMRLESIRYSKLYGTKSKNVMLGIDLMPSHSSMTSSGCWALITRGPGEMVNGTDGPVMLNSLKLYDEKWSPSEDEVGFLPAIDEYYQYLSSKSRFSNK